MPWMLSKMLKWDSLQPMGPFPFPQSPISGAEHTIGFIPIFATIAEAKAAGFKREELERIWLSYPEEPKQ